jgi:hypothetical protein
MADKIPAYPKQMLGIGCLAVAAGGYFALIGLGLLPVPGGPSNVHGPLWIVFCAGLVFVLGGSAVVLQALGRANDQGEFPADAPLWIRVAQYLMGVAIFACFAAIGSWIAFGPGERAFSGSIGLFSGEANARLGRIMFGIGAVVVWLCTIAFAVSGARKLLARRKRNLR